MSYEHFQQRHVLNQRNCLDAPMRRRTKECFLLKIPSELQAEILREVLRPNGVKCWNLHLTDGSRSDTSWQRRQDRMDGISVVDYTAVLRTCKQLHSEGQRILYHEVTFALHLDCQPSRGFNPLDYYGPSHLEFLAHIRNIVLLIAPPTASDNESLESDMLTSRLRAVFHALGKGCEATEVQIAWKSGRWHHTTMLESVLREIQAGARAHLKVPQSMNDIVWVSGGETMEPVKVGMRQGTVESRAMAALDLVSALII